MPPLPQPVPHQGHLHGWLMHSPLLLGLDMGEGFKEPGPCLESSPSHPGEPSQGKATLMGLGPEEAHSAPGSEPHSLGTLGQWRPRSDLSFLIWKGGGEAGPDTPRDPCLLGEGVPHGGLECWVCDKASV